MLHQPRVSVGLPVYNGERYLSECLDSLLSQTFEHFELIISDNASTDHTEEICRDYAARHKRVQYFRNEVNIGVNRNFNRVFQLASGEYFKWASADDVCHPQLVARCLEVLDHDSSVVLAYPKTTFIDANGKPLDWRDPGWNLRSDEPSERMRYVIKSSHWVNAFYGLVRTKDLLTTRLFPIYDSGDYRLLGELSLRGKFVEVPESLFFRRIHPTASSQIDDKGVRADFFSGHFRHAPMPFGHLCLDHAITVLNGKVALSKKVALFFTVLKRMLSGRNVLLRESIDVVRYALQENRGRIRRRTRITYP
jgi:glycosyltransferase involved in cell wall biosynthesis